MIDAEHFHEQTQRVLEAAGWFPQRRVATYAWRMMLINDGYQYSDSADAFLAQFGGLAINPVNTPEALFDSGQLVTDPSIVTGEYPRIQTREILLDESLCAIGEWEGESIVLLAPSGRVYAETTYQLLLLGETPRSALEVIIRAHRYPDVVKGRVWWDNKI